MGKHRVQEVVSRNPRRVALVVSVASALALIGTTAATPAGTHIAALGEPPQVSALRPGTRDGNVMKNRGVTLLPIAAQVLLEEGDDSEGEVIPDAVTEPVEKIVDDVTEEVIEEPPVTEEPTVDPEPEPTVDPEPPVTEEPEPPVTEEPEPTVDPEPQPEPDPVVDLPDPTELPGCS
jgi:outer membrane biosynthesis protein TonB